MFLPQVVDLLCLFIDLDLSLSDLIYELFGLTLHISNELNFLNILFLQNFNLDLHFLVFVSLDDQCLQKDVNLIDVVQFLEVWLQVTIHYSIGIA